MLNFYGNPISPYAQKVHFFLEEVGRPFKYHLVDLAKGDQRTAAFRSMNPFGQVPTVELDGFAMGESNAILRYLANKWERYDLFPANLEDRARVDNAFEFVNLHINRFLITLAWNLHFGPKFGQKCNVPAVEDAREALLRNLPKLESHLTGRSFLAGSALSLADICLTPFATQYRLAEVSLTDYPNVQSWVARLSDRPAWKKVMSEGERLMGQLRP